MHVLKHSGDPERLISDAERPHEQENVSMLASRLKTQALEQVGIKATIESRWLQDLRQYHGRYDADTEGELKTQEKSQLFFNLTRPKTNAWEARMSEMLFPTDEKNYAIGPTPDPELSRAIERGSDDEKAEAQARIDAAEEACDAMAVLIDDQFVECGYNAECRDSIHDMCKLGSAIMKGPIPVAKKMNRWAKGADGQYVVESAAGDTRPGYNRCDPWGQFPDMTARSVEECEFWFERFLLPKKSLLQLSRRPGFDADTLRRVTLENPGEGLPDWFSTLREMTNGSQDAPRDNRYHVWEYRGPVPIDEMISICKLFNNFDLMEILVSQNAVEEVDGVIWFCGNEVIKAGVNHLETGELPYSVACMEKDETSLFGFGVPYLMRHSQKAINAAWRAMIDNAGLTAGPQIVVNKDVVEPQDGQWRMSPNKIWIRKKSSSQDHKPFEAFDLQNNQAPLAAIVQMGREFVDEETSLPIIAQGEQGATPQQTASGMSMLMNSANVVFRRVVKEWDDEMTVPNVSRIYDWNMAFSKDEKVKGDFEVEAIGSSVLLTRELQTQNLMQILATFSAHPVLGPMLKARKALETLVQSLLLKASDLVKTEDELIAEAKEAAEAGGPPDIDMMKIEAQRELAQIKHDSELRLQDMKQQHELALASMTRDTVMMKLAAEQNMSLEKLAADLKKATDAIESNERVFAAEVAVKDRHGQGI